MSFDIRESSFQTWFLIAATRTNIHIDSSMWVILADHVAIDPLTNVSYYHVCCTTTLFWPCLHKHINDQIQICYQCTVRRSLAVIYVLPTEQWCVKFGCLLRFVLCRKYRQRCIATLASTLIQTITGLFQHMRHYILFLWRPVIFDIYWNTN